MSLTVRQQLEWAQEQVLPPLSFEVVLRSGRSYFAKWIFRFTDEDELITIRIWDFRAMAETDQGDLLARMNEIRDRADYEDLERLHPKLDQANLHVRLDQIEALLEWHDRLWPVASPGEEPRPRRIGFGRDESS